MAVEGMVDLVATYGYAAAVTATYFQNLCNGEQKELPGGVRRSIQRLFQDARNYDTPQSTHHLREGASYVLLTDMVAGTFSPEDLQRMPPHALKDIFLRQADLVARLNTSQVLSSEERRDCERIQRVLRSISNLGEDRNYEQAIGASPSTRYTYPIS